MTALTATLGETEVAFFAQRHARLAHTLKAFMDDVVKDGEQADVEGLLGYVGEQAYRLLDALNPNVGKRIALHTWMGYATAEAFAADEYDEEQDRSPTVAEIRRAIEIGFEVNGLDGLTRMLGNFLEPGVARALVTQKVIEAATAASAPESQTSVSPLTAEPSPSESSTTSPPTSTTNGASVSLSRDSHLSSEPASTVGSAS